MHNTVNTTVQMTFQGHLLALEMNGTCELQASEMLCCNVQLIRQLTMASLSS